MVNQSIRESDYLSAGFKPPKRRVTKKGTAVYEFQLVDMYDTPPDGWIHASSEIVNSHWPQVVEFLKVDRLIWLTKDCVCDGDGAIFLHPHKQKNKPFLPDPDKEYPPVYLRLFYNCTKYHPFPYEINESALKTALLPSQQIFNDLHGILNENKDIKEPENPQIYTDIIHGTPKLTTEYMKSVYNLETSAATKVLNLIFTDLVQSHKADIPEEKVYEIWRRKVTKEKKIHEKLEMAITMLYKTKTQGAGDMDFGSDFDGMDYMDSLALRFQKITEQSSNAVKNDRTRMSRYEFINNILKDGETMQKQELCRICNGTGIFEFHNKFGNCLVCSGSGYFDTEEAAVIMQQEQLQARSTNPTLHSMMSSTTGMPFTTTTMSSRPTTFSSPMMTGTLLTSPNNTYLDPITMTTTEMLSSSTGGLVTATTTTEDQAHHGSKKKKKKKHHSHTNGDNHKHSGKKKAKKVPNSNHGVYYGQFLKTRSDMFPSGNRKIDSSYMETIVNLHNLFSDCVEKNPEKIPDIFNHVSTFTKRIVEDNADNVTVSSKSINQSPVPDSSTTNVIVTTMVNAKRIPSLIGSINGDDQLLFQKLSKKNKYGRSFFITPFTLHAGLTKLNFTVTIEECTHFVKKFTNGKGFINDQTFYQIRRDHRTQSQPRLERQHFTVAESGIIKRIHDATLQQNTIVETFELFCEIVQVNDGLLNAQDIHYCLEKKYNVRVNLHTLKTLVNKISQNNGIVRKTDFVHLVSAHYL